MNFETVRSKQTTPQLNDMAVTLSGPEVAIGQLAQQLLAKELSRRAHSTLRSQARGAPPHAQQHRGGRAS